MLLDLLGLPRDERADLTAKAVLVWGTELLGYGLDARGELEGLDVGLMPDDGGIGLGEVIDDLFSPFRLYTFMFPTKVGGDIV